MDELAANGLGLLVVDQNVERVLDRTQRYYLMESGAVVRTGASSDPEALDAINAVILATKAAEDL